MTEGLIVGRVRGLWRYPVKSMLNDPITWQSNANL